MHHKMSFSSTDAELTVLGFMNFYLQLNLAAREIQNTHEEQRTEESYFTSNDDQVDGKRCKYNLSHRNTLRYKRHCSTKERDSHRQRGG